MIIINQVPDRVCDKSGPKPNIMETLTPFETRPVSRSRIREVDFDKLEFGHHLADHMLVCDFDEGDWQQPVILPLANLSLHPATLALHYGQTVFEGMKAFRMHDGRINIFRIGKHYERFVRSLDRMCMAIPPREIFADGLSRLVEMDQAWIPSKPGTALYLRPFEYASEARLGVKIAEQYRFVIITGPVPELYAKPLRVKVETNFIRAARGGTGFAKCGGNYGAAFYPTKLAKAEGYDQVLWTNAGDNRFIEESGTMNIMFVIRDTLITAPISDSILDGVTRDSLLQLAADMGFRTEERQISVDEMLSAINDGTLTEIFGAGTAAVVAPVSVVGIRGRNYELPEYGPDCLQNRIKQKLERIRLGLEPDIHGWNHIL